MELYLDWAATTPIHPEAAKEQKRVAEEFIGNPSSIHRWGVEARELLEACRKKCASLLGAKEKEVIFTGGGSESNNLVFTSLLTRESKGHLIVPLIEHPSVYEPSRGLERLGWEVTRLNASPDGRVDPDQVLGALKKNTALVSLMLVNNETGAIQPVRELVRELRNRAQGSRTIHVHVDAVQGAGKLPLAFKELGADTVAISAHKFQGPRGVGILLVRKPFTPLITGGGQEYGLRPGTENLPGIAAMTRALEIACADMEKNRSHAEGLTRLILQGIQKCRECRVLPPGRTGTEQNYSPYILSLSFPPIPGEVLVRVLSERGIGVSTGSACSSRKKKDTRVLEASGVSSELAFSSVRVSIGPAVTEEQVHAFIETLKAETDILFKVAK